ncbi:hypothetical protein THAOC_34817 [Thalassiosira oceanica]|uniref:Uncharacterized protein n=1 Tax=Thalassiosira oceanica TaxID=159749 RepID=K0RBP4_THAOC|nr:hypothetical protein THAOC_34817 [Thalassiosira oceanica]|eukprot:EJK46511.1 hypothetical protein THAOC_34817 [Thalassiosira oceanica]
MSTVSFPQYEEKLRRADKHTLRASEKGLPSAVTVVVSAAVKPAAARRRPHDGWRRVGKQRVRAREQRGCHLLLLRRARKVSERSAVGGRAVAVLGSAAVKPAAARRPHSPHNGWRRPAGQRVQARQRGSGNDSVLSGALSEHYQKHYQKSPKYQDAVQKSSPTLKSSSIGSSSCALSEAPERSKCDKSVHDGGSAEQDRPSASSFDCLDIDATTEGRRP